MRPKGREYWRHLHAGDVADHGDLAPEDVERVDLVGIAVLVGVVRDERDPVLPAPPVGGRRAPDHEPLDEEPVRPERLHRR